MKRVSTVVGVAACVGIALAGMQPANAMAGGKCTQKGTNGDDSIHVSIGAGETKVVCLASGFDDVTIDAIDTTSRLVLVKGGTGVTSGLIVVWEAGDKAMGDVSGPGEIALIRPVGVEVLGIQGDTNPNMNGFGAVALCGTNNQYALAADLTALVTATGGKSVSWFGQALNPDTLNNCTSV